MNSFHIGIFAFFSGVALFAYDGMAEGFSFSHKDWELVCDNTRTCRAAGYQADGDERLVSMLLTREAGPKTPVSMELKLDDEEKTADVVAQVGELVISNLAVGKIPQQEAAKLLAVMPDEEELILTAGDKQWKLSLAGLKAMLLKMDDKQGRVGTPGALIAKGTKPEEQVLPPIPMKTLAVPVIPPTTKEDEKILAALKEFLDAECAEKDDYCKTERKIERLSEDKLLVSMLVDRGMYNQTIAVWIVNDKSPYNPIPAIKEGLVHDVLSENPGFEVYNKGILYSSTRNSFGDCWYLCSWAWTGKSFEKATERPAGLCKGFIGGAWDLPTFVSEVADEYKAQSGGWKLLVKEDKVHRGSGTLYDLTVVSPEGKQIHVDDGVRNAEVKWLNGETIEIIGYCGTECMNVYFYNINKGLSSIFFNAITFSVENNLVAYPSSNDKKNRYEITISEIYTDKKQPVAVIHRNWKSNVYMAYNLVSKAVLSRDKIYIEYIDCIENDNCEEKKENILFAKEPPFVVCDNNSSKEEGREIEYCSIAEDNYKKGYIWFAAEHPPVGMIDTPKESPLCYRFPSFGLDDQLKKLKEKYGVALYDEKITKESDGRSSLSVRRKDETGKEIVYFYFDSPKSCAEYQTKRLGAAPPVPYYDYGGCVGECCQYAEWTAKEKIAVRKDHSDLSPIVTTIEANEKVDALTGVVITKQLGKIEILKNDGLSERMDCDLPIKKGDSIYSLHYLGEMNSLVWHNGQLYHCDVYPKEEGEEHLRVINKEAFEWWTKIATKNGKTGWTREIKKFSNVYSNE